MKRPHAKRLFMLLLCLSGAGACHGLDWSAIGGYIGYVMIGQPVKEGVVDSLFYSHADKMLSRHKQEIRAYAERGVPSVPKVAFINIDDFPETRDALGIESDEVGPFAMLTEDYVFYDLDGRATTIPKGFVFDGASFPKGTLAKFLIHGAAGVHGSAYDPTVLAAGLIHDYMYRNPDGNPLYTQEYADMMIAVNATISGNRSAMEIWEGLWLAGSKAYGGHADRRQNGDYEIFTEKYYSREYGRYVGLRDGWTPDQLFRRGGPTAGDDPSRTFTGSGAGEGDNGGGDAAPYPAGGLFDGSLEEFYSTAMGTAAPVAVVGPCIPYRRLLYLFSGDHPGVDDFGKTWASAEAVFRGDSWLKDDLGEYEKMSGTMRELGSDMDAYRNFWEAIRSEWNILRDE